MKLIVMQIRPTAKVLARPPLNMKCYGKLTIKYYLKSTHRSSVASSFIASHEVEVKSRGDSLLLLRA